MSLERLGAPQIPHGIRQCVVFLSYVGKDGQRKFAGTAFFCGVGEGENVFSYLVTANHVDERMSH
jgi:hypothetical protein